ncbi:hypothetical protein [Pseudolactococcus hodotermopsidis]|nr:hypothetical protein [Lactococcus hodotermopsidis]
MTFILTIVLLERFAKNLLVVTVPQPYDLILIISLTIILVILGIILKTSLLKEFIPLAVVMTSLALIARTPFGENIIAYFKESEMKTLVGSLLVDAVAMISLTLPFALQSIREKKLVKRKTQMKKFKISL